MDGVLVVDKPTGLTSFDVVAKVRSALRCILATLLKPVRGEPPNSVRGEPFNSVRGEPFNSVRGELVEP